MHTPHIGAKGRARRARFIAITAAAAACLAIPAAVWGGGDHAAGTGPLTEATTYASSPLVLPTGKVKCGATRLGDDPCRLPAKPPPGKHVRIAFFGISGVDYTVVVQKAVIATAKANNASVDVFLNPFDPALEARQLQDAIAQDKYDAYIIEPVNPSALKPLMKQLVKKGRPFSTWVLTNGTNDASAKLQFPGQTLQSTRTPASQADDLAAGTIAACGKKNPCNVGYIRGLPVLPFDNAMVKSFKASFARRPNIKVVSTVIGEYSTAGARKAMQDLLQAHPDVDVVATHSDGMTLGAEQAVKAAGIKAGQIKYTSMGGGSYSVKAIKAGRWFSSALVLPTNEGIINAIAVISAARGVKLSLGIATIDTRGPLPSNLSRTNLRSWRNFKGQYLGI